jgi:hypothetical protein
MNKQQIQKDINATSEVQIEELNIPLEDREAANTGISPLRKVIVNKAPLGLGRNEVTS